MRQPFSPLHLLLFIFFIGFLMAIVQFGLISLTFQKLGLSPGSAFLLLFASLFGSAVNLPLFTIRADPGERLDLGDDRSTMPDEVRKQLESLGYIGG